MFRCSGSGGGVLPADLTVENHGEDHAGDQQDGDGECDSHHHLHVFLHQMDDLAGAGRGVDARLAVCIGGVAATGVRDYVPV